MPQWFFQCVYFISMTPFYEYCRQPIKKVISNNITTIWHCCFKDKLIAKKYAQAISSLIQKKCFFPGINLRRRFHFVTLTCMITELLLISMAKILHQYIFETTSMLN